MELLTGEDMATLRNRIRINHVEVTGGLIPIPIASYLALQMLRCVHTMHSNGYVHRDIKPSNFVRKNKNSTEFCIIDFGITKQVI